jgi:predicted O-linked N-acetylglucosamine transferase (SPINDLY family)
MGVSMMNNVGLPEFIAQSKAEYVEIAKRLAGDIPFLQSVRASLRERMVASPLRDEIGYVRRLEAAYWTMARAKGLR